MKVKAKKKFKCCSHFGPQLCKMALEPSDVLIRVLKFKNFYKGDEYLWTAIKESIDYVPYFCTSYGTVFV